jgi:glutaredoxin
MPSAASISPATVGIRVPETDPRARPRARSALAALAALALAVVLMVALSPRSASPIMCGRDHTPGADTVVMLSATWCGYCRRARTWLQDEGVEYCEYDVESSAEGRRRFAAAPVKVVPILEIHGDTLVGFNRTEIEQTLIAHGLADFAE